MSSIFIRQFVRCVDFDDDCCSQRVKQRCDRRLIDGSEVGKGNFWAAQRFKGVRED
jgi:hypothetical protein